MGTESSLRLVVLGLLLILVVAACLDGVEAQKKTTTKRPTTTKRTAVTTPSPNPARARFDYSTAIHYVYLYFWAQRSGRMPYHRLAWRSHSCLDCKGPNGEDMSGGWYEASNALHFGLLNHFTHTQLGWIAWEFSRQLDQIGQLREARDWVRVGADHTFNAHSAPDRLVAMMGIAEGSDFLWQGPPEEWVQGLGYDRSNGTFSDYINNSTQPGAEIAAQASAGMSLCYLNFRDTDAPYAERCLAAARSLLKIATDRPVSFVAGTWADRSPSMKYHKRYYESGGVQDEIALASAFLYLATNETTYLTSARTAFNAASRAARGWSVAYSWDDKLPGVALLLMRIDNRRNTVYEQFLQRAFAFWFRDCVGRKCGPDQAPGSNGCRCVFYSPRGLAIRDGWGSLASSTNMGFLAMQYARWLRTFNPADPYAAKLIDWTISQVNYVLGGSNGGYSFMVGFGRRSAVYPLHISSYNSFIDFPMRGQTPFAIQQDFTPQGYGATDKRFDVPRFKKPQRFILYGGVQGGPEWYNDRIIDDHWNFTYTEPTVDYSAAFLGAAIGLVDVYRITKKGTDCGLNLGWSHRNARANLRPTYNATDCYHRCC
ncbi:Six-hairpin glycosidase-like protein [Hyaloraphidium curvatum]|nr:Six-hairpin glycosidase-like protein [Hyaloraphidium curvatum]